MPRYLTRLLVAFAAMFMLHATPAAAQATRTWVSGVGDDVNPCSRTAPCKTFAGAISKTAAGGEINCLDSGGFGGVTITKSITIRCVGVEGGVLVSGSNGIVINAAAADRVVLDGLDIFGASTTLNGVQILSARDVVIRNSTIQNFIGATNSCVNIASSAQIRVTIENSLLFNCGTGVSVASTASTTAKVYDTLIGGMSVTGISASGALNKAEISQVEIFGTPKSLTISAGGVISSYGNNALSGVTTDAPTLIPLQ